MNGVGIHIGSKEKPTIGWDEKAEAFVVEFPEGFDLRAWWEIDGLGPYFGSIQFSKEELENMSGAHVFFGLLSDRARNMRREIITGLSENRKETNAKIPKTGD